MHAAGFVHQKVGSRKVPVVAALPTQTRRRVRPCATRASRSASECTFGCGTTPGCRLASRSSMRLGPASCAPARPSPALTSHRRAIARRAAAAQRRGTSPRSPAHTARPAPAGRRRPARPTSSSPARPAMKARVPSIGSTTQTRSACERAPDRPRFPPTASRRRRESRSRVAQEIVDRDVGLADRRMVRALGPVLERPARRSRARSRRPRA